MRSAYVNKRSTKLRFDCDGVQVYLQAAQGDAQTWNAQFSSMMMKLLQDTYASTPLHKANLARSDVLMLEAAPRVGPPKVGTSVSVEFES